MALRSRRSPRGAASTTDAAVGPGSRCPVEIDRATVTPRISSRDAPLFVFAVVLHVVYETPWIVQARDHEHAFCCNQFPERLCSCRDSDRR